MVKGHADDPSPVKPPFATSPDVAFFMPKILLTSLVIRIKA